jgi:hypothetical protein
MAQTFTGTIDILVRIDCPHCQGELIVVESELEAAESPIFCDGCGGTLDLGTDGSMEALRRDDRAA